MLRQKNSTDKGFWLQWMLATAVGGTTGPLLMTGVLRGMEGESRVGGTVAIYAIYAALVGLAQSLVLRRHLSIATGWVLATTSGGLLCGIIAASVGSVADVVLGNGGFGALLGILQWLVLRDRLSNAAWWLVASPLSWTCGVPVALLVERVLVLPETWGLILAFAIIATVDGMLSGIVLVRLLRRVAPVELTGDY